MWVQTAARMSQCAPCKVPRPSPGADLHRNLHCQRWWLYLQSSPGALSHTQTAPAAPPKRLCPETTSPKSSWNTEMDYSYTASTCPKTCIKKDMYLLTPAANPSCMSTASSPFLYRVILRGRGKQIYLWQSLKCKSLMPSTLDPKPSPSSALQGPCSDLQAISRGAKLAPLRQITNLLLVWLCFSSATWQLTRHWNCWDKVILSVDLGFRHP